ncbi:MAG: glycine cleavage system protein H, partial [Lachnospiraceae bacterium]
TDYVQEQLGSILYVDLPAYGDTILIGDNFTEVESSKATLEAPSPLTGRILEVNELLDDSPEVINDDAYGSWIVKLEIQDEKELDDLLDPFEYMRMIGMQQDPLFD